MARSELRLSITHSLRLSAVRGTFYARNFGLLNHQSDILMPSGLISVPFVVITYRVAIVDDRHDEIWSCDMNPTADGFDVVSMSIFF